MKLLIASDIHGAAGYCRQLLDAWDREGADRLLLLGDVLYHGPRNDLPPDYAPKEVIALLNARKDKIFCVRGNCDTEVDQMVLEFPILADYAVFTAGQRLVYATHGHVYNTAHLPPLQAGDILLHGHTHVPAWQAFGNDNYYQPRLHLHPQGKQRPRVYDAERRRVYVENAGRGDVSRSKSVTAGAGDARPLQRTRCRERRPRRPAGGAPPCDPTAHPFIDRGVPPMKIPAKGFTHGGKFHADDAFSTALLQILRPDIQVTRGFVVPDDFDGIVYDVGGGMFDHHSEPRECRPNGVPYAAFGLLWRVVGAQLVGEHQARLLDENFIQPLDLNDNTGEQNSLADAIGSFNPLWDSKDDPDACFWRAVPVAKQILENEIAAANAVNRADDTVRRAYANMRDGIVVLPAYMPWKNGLYKTDAIFVVYPSQRGGYSAQCVNDHRTKRSKQPFPVAWAGKPEEQLRQISGLGLRFCHPSRFLITADDKATAIEACRRTLRAAGKKVSE